MVKRIAVGIALILSVALLAEAQGPYSAQIQRAFAAFGFQKVSGGVVGQYGLTAVLFANLGTPANGTFCYCSDCTIANPCAGAGTGSFAKRLNGVWVCN